LVERMLLSEWLSRQTSTQIFSEKWKMNEDICWMIGWGETKKQIWLVESKPRRSLILWNWYNIVYYVAGAHAVIQDCQMLWGR
jgi:hypothetical protein